MSCVKYRATGRTKKSEPFPEKICSSNRAMDKIKRSALLTLKINVRASMKLGWRLNPMMQSVKTAEYH